MWLIICKRPRFPLRATPDVYSCRVSDFFRRYGSKYDLVTVSFPALSETCRVIVEAKDRGWQNGDVAPPLPGVDWSFGLEENGDRLDEEWWSSAMVQQQPLVMRTSEQFYGALER